MTHDDIIRMAREAGLKVATNISGITLVGAPLGDTPSIGHITIDEMECFAALVRADERERCAKVCEENGKEPDDHKAHEGYEEGYQDGSNNCAAAIRARGQG